MNYMLKNVTNQPDLWELSDPVRPYLHADFKTAPGRGVFGLVDESGEWKAFLCYARTFLVPRNVQELESFTTIDGNVIIPYTVWSHEKGAGRTIINEVMKFVQDSGMCIDRIVTLSPLTEMARKFHLRNNALEFRMNETTVNFEYRINNEEA